MSTSKAEAAIELHDSELQKDVVVSVKKGTPDDQKDMHRMGKTQELRRNFRFVSIFGYSMILMATWETVLTLVVVAEGLYLMQWTDLQAGLL